MANRRYENEENQRDTTFRQGYGRPMFRDDESYEEDYPGRRFSGGEYYGSDYPRQGRPGYNNRNLNLNEDRMDYGSNRSTNRFDGFGPARTGGGSENYETRTNHSGKGPKGWSRSDERIREDVCEALERDSYVDASEIDVKVENGIVTLSGSVDERRIKRMAEDCVEDVSGVKDVQNQLRVQDSSRSSDRTSDISSESSTGRNTARH